MTKRATSCGVRAFAVLAAAAFLALPARTGAADDPPAPDAAAAADAKVETAPTKEPKTETVTRGEFKVTLDLAGTFDARRSWEILLDAEQWAGDLEVVECAMPGPVEKGATLVRFKTDKIDEALAAGERDLAIARLNFQRQTEDLKRQEELQAIALKQAEMQAQAADIALKRFLEWERELRLKESDQRIQQTRDNLADQDEELRQLEKMYKADELTEETEEIVLMRAKRQLARSKFWLESQLARDEAWRTQDLPRDQENLETAQRKTALEAERARAAAAPQSEAAKVEYEKAKVGLAKQEENLGKLRRDREQFTLVAPEAGLAVFGSLNRGKWASTDVPPQALIAQGRYKVKPNQVLFTIVQPGDVHVRTAVAEAALLSVTEGLKAKVRPGTSPRSSLAATVARVARTSTGTDYEVIVELESPDARLVPGNTCKVSLTTAEKKDALTVPAAAVESDGDDRYLHVWAGGKATRTKVEVGDTSGGRTEILSGAQEGDRVLAAAPKAK